MNKRQREESEVMTLSWQLTTGTILCVISNEDKQEEFENIEYFINRSLDMGFNILHSEEYKALDFGDHKLNNRVRGNTPLEECTREDIFSAKRMRYLMILKQTLRYAIYNTLRGGHGLAYVGKVTGGVGHSNVLLGNRNVANIINNEKDIFHPVVTSFLKHIQENFRYYYIDSMIGKTTYNKLL
jgi:hypothetical protein